MEESKVTKAHAIFDTTAEYLPTVLNFHQNSKGEFGIYGEAYHRAAKHLLDGIVKHELPYVLDACPIVYLYRHALELHMKHTILQGNRFLKLQGNPPVAGEEILRQHRLPVLLVPIEKILENMSWKDSIFEGESVKSFDDCKTILKSIDEIDARSNAFRYPVDTSGKASVDERFSFDIHRFASLIEPVVEVFSTAGWVLEFEYDRLNDTIQYRHQQALEELLRS